MRFALFLLALVPAPLFAAAPPHSGIPNPRTMPELSDMVLVILAGLGIWFARRAMRRRFRGPSED